MNEVMEKVQRQVPTLRFPGYKGAWKNVSLENATGKTISYGIVQAGEHVEGGMPYIKSIDLNEELSLDRLQRTSMEIAHKYRRSEVVPGDIVFSLRGNIGVSQIVPSTIEVANLTQGTARISVSNEHSNVFVQTALQTEKIIKHVLAVMKGSTFQEISLGDLRQVEIHAPTLPEQQKIAAFLGAVDRKIQHLERKQALLEQYKKGVVQQLFSQELRFKRKDGGDFAEWEEKRLGDVGDIITGKTPLTAEADLWGGDIQFITPTDINENNKYQHTTQRYVQPHVKLKLLPANSIVYTCIASIGKMAMTVHPAITNQQINAVVPSKGYSREFIYYALLHLTPSIKATQANTTLPIINKTEFCKILLPIPSLEEQSRIAGFLMALDAKVAGVAQAVAACQKWKKGLLQQLFV
jgi:type I restriction enzyme S subunit